MVDKWCFCRFFYYFWGKIHPPKVFPNLKRTHRFIQAIRLNGVPKSVLYESYCPLMDNICKGTKIFRGHQIFYRLFLLFFIRINIFLIPRYLTYHARFPRRAHEYDAGRTLPSGCAHPPELIPNASQTCPEHICLKTGP